MRHKIYVDEGTDTAVYFVNEDPTYQSVPVPSIVDGEVDSRIVFVTFVPSNGPGKGKVTHVPFVRVVAISDDA